MCVYQLLFAAICLHERLQLVIFNVQSCVLCSQLSRAVIYVPRSVISRLIPAPSLLFSAAVHSRTGRWYVLSFMFPFLNFLKL